jgi:membrane fusion protein, multidrug efflux system
LKRRIAWALGGLAVLVVVAAVARLVIDRRATQQAAAAPRTPAVLSLAASDIVTARPVELARSLEVSGSVRAVQTAFVKARVAGEITRIAVREGEAVRRGQVLVQQDTSDLESRLRQAQEQARSARAQLDIAQRTLANNRALVAQGFISATALDTSSSNEAAAQANLQAALAGVEIARKALADATLSAPLSGIVSQRLAQPGERVSIDTRILEIVDLSTLEVELALSPEDVAGVRLGQTARLQVDGIAEPVTARVARISPSALAGSRTIPVWLTLDPHPALRHGLFARGRIDLERQRVLALPASAVRVDRADPYVLMLDGGRVQARGVRTGTRGQGPVDDPSEWVAITQGLADGTRVLAGRVGAVTDGTAWQPEASASAAAPAPASAASR